MEIALNVWKGNIPLTDKQYKQLKKAKNVSRIVADKKVKLVKKKKASIRQVVFLLPLLVAATFITSLLTRG